MCVVCGSLDLSKCQLNGRWSCRVVSSRIVSSSLTSMFAFEIRKTSRSNLVVAFRSHAAGSCRDEISHTCMRPVGNLGDVLCIVLNKRCFVVVFAFKHYSPSLCLRMFVHLSRQYIHEILFLYSHKDTGQTLLL